MAEEKDIPDICESEKKRAVQAPDNIDSIVEALISSCKKDDCFNNVDLSPLPSMDALIGIVRQTRDIIFPGYFCDTRMNTFGLKYHIGRVVLTLFEDLTDQIILSMRHKCMRGNLPCSRSVSASESSR